MKALWTEPRVNFGGRSWQLKDPAMSLSHSRSRIRRSGSAPAIPMRCDARSGTATASSEPGRPRRNSSPSRCRSYGRHSPRRGATPLASRSASASTSPSTMTPSARAGESASRCNLLPVLRVERPGGSRGLRAARRLRARSARRRRGGRGADPAQPGLRRGRADGAPGGRGGAQALVMLLEETFRSDPTHKTPHSSVQLRVACRKRDKRRQSGRRGQR
jgi:hypothetical protein